MQVTKREHIKYIENKMRPKVSGIDKSCMSNKRDFDLCFKRHSTER